MGVNKPEVGKPLAVQGAKKEAFWVSAVGHFFWVPACAGIKGEFVEKCWQIGVKYGIIRGSE